jgi:hypothetical protein
MNALWLDYQQDRPAHRAGSALLALALLLLILSFARYQGLNGEAEAWEQKLEQAPRAQGLRATAAGREVKSLSLEVKRANEVLRQLTLPWEDLLQGVEAAADKRVALLAVEPDAEKQVVRISGEARDFAALLKYIERLDKQPVFGPVYLQSHRVMLRDPERPVRFALQAVWRSRS